ncbi:MAG: Methionyl-tRNA formyltransferase (EC [uncultured Sulfurovum sp.]|uniref:Methionyl-tRNA formyltransferase n=1 Tax=uncultured Sulfurovum sp. TaxID=269237 RepID=A0A6S6SAK9_9BACT|nr:MAG: Methionyl-tRNA formyltransferase (EC [uncultured Sulfurovum sp.]
MKKIVYMGTPHYAKEILQTLIDDEQIEISLVLSQPDRKAGRKGELKAPEVKVLAEEHGLKILQPERLSDEGIYEAIVEAKPDYIVVAAFGQLLPKSILDIAPCINLHASLLPQYRGASPVQQSLLHGDEFTGITAMLMEEGLDSGPILGYRYFKIPETMLLPELMNKLSDDACTLTTDIIHRFDSIEPMEQNRAVATHCKKIKKIDGLVDFSSASKFYDKYRAFEGWPGIFVEGGMKIKEVALVEITSQNEEGVILELKDESIVVACIEGSLEIGTLQPASKKAVNAKAYCVGRGLKVGTSLL